MSAEKCGIPLTADMFEEATKKFLEPTPKPPIIVGPRAYRMLQKIRFKFPDFEPLAEAEIWFKAYKMGITEDE